MSDKNNEAEIIPSNLAIIAMRDSGYKNTAYALAELIDNSQQAEADLIELLCLQKRVQLQHREVSRLSKIAVLDNGKAMDKTALKTSLQFGNGSRLNDRSGIGRFGMGLPNASISQAGRVDVWSWKNGPDNALHTYLDVEEIESAAMTHIPEPENDAVPQEWREKSEGIGKSGTLVVWTNLDPHRLTWKSAKSTLENTERLVGRIYRRFINKDELRIRLCAFEEDGTSIYCEDAQMDDPLYLTPSSQLPPPFNKTAMFELLFDDPVVIEYKGEKHVVNTRYSFATQSTIDEVDGTKNRGDMPYGKHAARNMGVSVVRADRELMLDQGWCIGYDPVERWWSAEVEFPPALDEVFGVSNNKQAATHFSELAKLDWQQLAEEGEEFIQVISRLKEEGDPRGYLLTLSDKLSRNIAELRKLIKGQGKGLRGGAGSRHREADDATSEANSRWKKRNQGSPLKEDNEPTSDEELKELENDLKQKEYTENEIENLVGLIKSEDLKVIFLEAEFMNPYALFNVERKGVTEVTFNRRHPAFEDIFGTINMVDENVEDLSKGEVLDRLYRASNATKILFAAWARYEREAGMEKAKKLEKVRFDWGQMASQFLDNDDTDL